MSGALRNDGFFDDIDQDGFWSDEPKPPAQKTIGQMRAEAGPIQDLKAPAAPLGRTGDGGIADVFASFMQHFQGADEAAMDSQGITSNLLRTKMGTTPILDERQADTIRSYEESTPFWKEPSLAEKVAGGLGAGAGSVTGSTRDPLGLIGGVGKTIASTFLQNSALAMGGDSLSQLFTKDLPTQYNPNAEVYNPQTQEFDENGPAYVAPGFDITRAVGSGVASGTAATVLSGQAFKEIFAALDSLAKSDRSLFDSIIPGFVSGKEVRDTRLGKKKAAPGETTPDVEPEVDPFAALPDNVKAVFAANGITPGDPRITQALDMFAPGWSSAPNRADERDTSISLAELLTKKMQPKQPPLSEGQGAARMFDESRAAEAAGEKPAVSAAFDPRTGLPEQPTGMTPRPKFDVVELYKSGGDADKAFSTEQVQTPLVPDVLGERGVRTPGETGFDPGAREAVRRQKEAGLIDITPEQKQLLEKEWGILPETVETRRKAWRALEAEQARQKAADAQGAMRVTDTSGEAIPGARPGDPDTAARTSPVSRPLERGLAEDDTGAFENLDARVTPRTQPASGNSDRPFRATDTGTPDGEGSGRIEFDLMKAAREGDPNAGFRERTKAEDFEADARARADNARRETIEDLERFWQYKKERRERDAGARARYEQRQEKAQQKYEGKASSTKEKGFDPDGRYEVDESGFVLSDKGGPIIFAEHVQAAEWILKAQRESLDQNFEIHNHPTKSGSLTVREFSRTSKSSAGGRTDSNTGSDAGAKSAGPEQGNRSESQSGAGNARASEGVSDDGSSAGPRGEAGNARDSAEGASGETRPLAIEQRRVAETDARRKAQAAEAELKALREESDKLDAELKAAKAEGKTSPKSETPKAGTTGEEIFLLKNKITQLSEDIKAIGHKGTARVKEYEESAAIKAKIEAKKRKTPQDRTNLEAANAAMARLTPEIKKLEDEIVAARKQRDDMKKTLAENEAESVARSQRAEKAAADAAKAETPGQKPGKAENPRVKELEAKIAEAKKTRDAKAEELKKLKAEAAEADKKAASEFKEEGKPKPGIPEGAKDPNAPVYESFFGFDKRPISKDDLTEDGYPKAFGEPDLKPEAKSGNKTTKFYSNPFGDPDVWKPIIKDIVAMAASVRKGLGQLRSYLNNTAAFGVYTRMEDFVRYGVYSNPGFARAFIDRYRGNGNEAVAKKLDALFNKMYTRPGEGGKTGIVRESWAEAVEPVVMSWTNRIGNILEPVAKRGDAALKKFAEDYQYRGKFSPEDAKIAQSLRKIMKEFRDDMNKRLAAVAQERIKSARNARERNAMIEEAKNLQIGFIDNYLPRMLDMEKLLATGAEVKFKKAAMREYMRQHNLDKVDAEDAARSYFLNATGANFSTHTRGTNRADTLKSRVFEARRDSALNEFYVDNPVESIYSYMLNTVRSVAHMERFGVNNEAMERELTDLAELGMTAGDISYLKNIIETSTGSLNSQLPLGVEQVAGMLRLHTTIRFLDQATLSSLLEPLAVAARSGEVMDSVKAMFLTIRNLANKGDAEDWRNVSEALGITGSAFSDSMMANKFMGRDLDVRWQRRLSSRFFRQIGLTQLTHATRQASVQLGSYFITKQLRNFSTGRAKESAKQALAELGIEEKMVKPIMDMLGENKGVPSLTKIMGDAPEAKAYRTALTRFVNESIMNPTASDRPGWASSPFGALMFGIASFQSAFTRNVLFRTAKQVGGAVGGVARGEMGAMDFYNRAVGPVIGLGILSYAQAMMGYLRDQVNNPEQAAQRTDEQNALLMFSRAGLFGNLDKFINGVYGVKYGQDVKNIFVGPGISTLFRDGVNFGKAAIDDNPRNNTDEWKATKSAYELTVPFLIGGMITAASKAPLPVRAGLGIWLLSPLSPGAPQTAVEVANAVAGERTTKQFRDDKPNKGLFSEMPSLISGANASEVPAPAKSSRKRKYVISRDADGNLIAGTGNSTYLIKRDKSGRIEVEER